MWRKAITRQIACDMVWTSECSRLRRLTTMFWGIASQWITNDHTSTWDFTRTSVPTRMVRCYVYPRLNLIHCFEVPVVVVFTKYDQFLINVEMHVDDYPHLYPDSNVSEVAEKLFLEHYLRPLGDDTRYVRLKSGFSAKCQQCSTLMFFGRNARARYSVQWSYWEDCCGTESRYCCTDAFCSSEG